MELIILMLLMLWYQRSTEQEVELIPIYNKVWDAY